MSTAREEDDDKTDQVAQLMVHVAAFTSLAYDSSDNSDDGDDSDDETNQGRVIPRANRVKYDHVKTHADIMTGILYPDAILSGSQFKLFYRISKRRFQAILEDVCNDDETFYHPSLTKGAVC